MFLRIALKDLKTMSRDRMALAIIILMPLAMILVLGLALGSMFGGNLEIERFRVAVVDNDNDIMSDVLINSVLIEGLGEMIDTYVTDEQEALEMLAEGEVPTVIMIPEKFSRNIDSGTEAVIEVRSRTDDTFKSNIIESVVESFTDSLSQNYKGAEIINAIMNQYDIPIPDSQFGNMSAESVMMLELQKASRNQFLEFSQETEKKATDLSAFQYYAGTMLGMFILFGANMGAALIIEERENRTLSRILMAMPGKISLISGKLLGIFMICFAQAIALIIFTSIFYGISWGDSSLGILVTTIAAAFAASGFGVMMAAIAKTRQAVGGMGQVFIQTFNLVGGGIMPVFLLPKFVQYAANVMPNWWTLKTYHSLMVGGTLQEILPSCGILVLIGFAYMTFGILRFKTA